MPRKTQYNVRRSRGKRKGQFAKQKVVDAREKLVAAVSNSRKRKNEEVQMIKENVLYLRKSDPTASKTRRIVELDTLGDQLWCSKCCIPLSLSNTINEIIHGLASILTILCMQCNIQYRVTTNQRDKYTKLFNVNSKLAFGMIDAGCGESHVNSLLSSLNVPAVSQQLMKRHERIVGPAIEAVAKQSCIDSIKLEKEQVVAAMKEEQDLVDKNIANDSNNNSAEKLDSESVPLKAGYDAGWQKRGTGHSYNSLSGHGTVFGYKTGKVLSYAIRNEDCRFCKLGHPKYDHDCRANFSGSAKSMEPDMAVELLTKNPLFEQEKVHINVLIGDDDSSTIAAVRRAASHEIEKWSDFNHTLKSFTSALYALKMNPKLIKYFSKCFSHAVKQNKGDAQEVKNALENILPHAFGDHEKCGEWCEGRILGDQYIHKNLPKGKPLSDPALRLSLTKLLSKYIKTAKQISQCGSTQANESLNNLIATKNPKSRHYAASESLSYRVSAAVCQKNCGVSYASKVFDKLKYSPGQETQRYRTMKDKSRARKALYHKIIKNKRRRNEIKKSRSSKTAAAGRKEGVTYESGVALDDISDLISNSISEDIGPVRQDLSNDSKIIIFDLETTGLSKSDEICQIAAYHTTHTFNAYIIPSKSMSKKASEVTGLQIIDGDLYLHDEKVQALPARTALIQFIDYLKNFECPIVLMAHNGFRFDVDRITKLLRTCGLMHEFQQFVIGFADSLQIIRQILPERRKEKKKFSVAALTADYLPDENLNCLHNAIDDVRVLRKLVDKIGVCDAVVLQNTKTLTQIDKEERKTSLEAINKASLQEYKGNLSANMISKMARNGITKQVLQDVFQKSGNQGIRLLLGENVNGKPRITKNKKILQQVCAMFTDDKENI